MVRREKEHLNFGEGGDLEVEKHGYFVGKWRRLFHAYAKGRKSSNIIWILIDEQGEEQSYFERKAIIGVEHLRVLYKAPN